LIQLITSIADHSLVWFPGTMVTRRTDAEKAARATSRRERRREPIPTRGRVDTRAPAVPRLQHNASDVEHDSNEGRIQSPGTREPHALTYTNY
jgi:hypothetical protein